MTKTYKIILLFISLIFLTTFNPKDSNLLKKQNLSFKVQRIEIINNNRIKKTNILKKLEYLYKKNIFFIDKESLKEHLSSINFLEKIEVKKKYPDTIIVKVYETIPLAALYKNNKKYIIDNSSKLILFDKKVFNEDFPVLFGENSDLNFVSFFKKLEYEKFPIKKIKNYYYFQIDRWDINLKNGQIRKLPSDKKIEAIKEAIKLLKRKDFKNYNIIDLRIYGKVIVE